METFRAAKLNAKSNLNGAIFYCKKLATRLVKFEKFDKFLEKKMFEGHFFMLVKHGLLQNASMKFQSRFSTL